MTANQIAYQQNLIRQEEAWIKQKEADIKQQEANTKYKQYRLQEMIDTEKLRHQELMDVSTHLHEYGSIRKAGTNAYVTVNSDRNQGLRQQEVNSKASKNYADVIGTMFKVGQSLFG